MGRHCDRWTARSLRSPAGAVGSGARGGGADRQGRAGRDRRHRWPAVERTASDSGPRRRPAPRRHQRRASRVPDAVESRLGPLEGSSTTPGSAVGPFVDESDPPPRSDDVNIMGVIIGSKLSDQRFRPRPGTHRPARLDRRQGRLPGSPRTARPSTRRRPDRSDAGRAPRDGPDRGDQVLPIGVNTELYSGVKQARGVKTPQPEDAPTRSRLLETGSSSRMCRGRPGPSSYQRTDGAGHRGDHPDHQGGPGAPQRRPHRPRGLGRRMAQMFDGPAVPVAVPDEPARDAA